VSLRLGSDALNQWFKTPGSFQTYLLFTMQTEQASAFKKAMQTFISSKGYFRRRSRKLHTAITVGDWWSLSGSNR
ncbi:hypothetical protein, partial [Agrobacterium rosae]